MVATSGADNSSDHAAMKFVHGAVPRDEFKCRGDAFDDLLVSADRPRTDKCNMCGSTYQLEGLPCCGVVVCNREQRDYVPGSWSRNFCNRSHRRNTQCYTHYEVRYP
jgi:hypothetical protein